MRLLCIIAALLLSAVPASAQWTGCKFGIGAGVLATSTETAATSPLLPGASLVIDGLSTQGVTGTGTVGCDVQVGNFVVGAFADYTVQENEWKTTIAAFGGAAEVKTAIKDQWSIGGRAGVLVTPTTLIYGLVAYTEAKTDDLTLSATGLNGLSWNVGDLTGYQVGGGIEALVMKNITVGLEYRWTRFDSANVQITQLPASLDLDTDAHAVRFSVAYRFGASDNSIFGPTK